jgi:phosphate butyryltransferase
MPLDYLSRLLSMAKQSSGPRTVAVAAAGEQICLESVVVARQEDLVRPVLYGDQPVIKQLLGGLGQKPADYEIHHVADPMAAAEQAVEAVATGQCQMLMKGLVQTGDLFHAYFDKRWNLRYPGRIMSHIGLFEVPGYPRLFAMTDAAINVELDEGRLVSICRNAVEFMHRLGWARPKVALLAGTSRVNRRQPVTGRAERVAELATDGITDAVFVGPLAIDEALSPRAVEIKRTGGSIAGDADVLVVPYLEVGNVFYKTMTALYHAKVVGAVIGGRAPVILTSRADSEETKLFTVALSCYLVESGSG